MSSPFAAPPRLLGVRLTDTDYDSPRHELGSVILGIDGVRYRYVLAAEAIAQYDAVDFTAAYSASVTDNDDYFFAVAQVAIASGDYGWIAEAGVITANVTTSLAAGASLARDNAAGGDINVVTTGDGVEVPCGIALTAESGGTATVLIF